MDRALAALTLQQINIFLTVVEENGFARAGKKLFMTQPAVSKSIAKLEKNLGFPLFIRTTRSHTLTEAGQLLYKEWKRQFAEIEQAYQQAKTLQRQSEQILSIGVLNTARPERYFYPIVDRMKAEHPEVKLEYEFDYMSRLEESLINGYKYDLIMIPDYERYHIEAENMAWRYAAIDYMYLLISKNHRLADRESVRTEDFADEPMIEVYSDGQQHWLLKDLTERMEKIHRKPKVSFSLRNAYDARYIQMPEEVVMLTDNYFDYASEEMNRKQIRVEDQVGGIICAWNPDNPKQSLRDFLDLLPEEGNGLENTGSRGNTD